MSRLPRLELALLAALVAQAAGPAPQARQAAHGEATPARAAPSAEAILLDALGAEGVRVDREEGLLWLAARVGVRDQLLEHALTGEAGATHESLFVTTVTPSVLNAGLLLLGLEHGVPARWLDDGPAPAPRQPSARSLPHAGPPRVEAPQGMGLFVYAAWRADDEVYLYRIEDLVENLATGRSMRRHAWVYLGSRTFWRDNLSKTDRERELVFAADVLQNLINIAFFYEGDALVTAALESCRDQNIWRPIAALLPERDAPVVLVLSRRPLTSLPPAALGDLPALDGGQRAPAAIEGARRPSERARPPR